MKMFNIDARAKTHKLIVASIPKWLINYICVYCLAKKRTRSSILAGLLIAWHEQTKIREPLEKLVQDVIDLVRERWKIEQVKHPQKTFEQFKEELDKELRKRGLNPMQINIIFKAFQ